jgi:PAS domain S-box-containing protein
MKPLSLTQRFAGWFVLVSLLPLLLSGWLLFRSYQTELRQTVLRQLENIADKKLDQIDAYLNGRLTEARIFSGSPDVHEAVRDFSQAFARDGAGAAPYRELDARWRPYFADYLERSGYYDVFLISPQGAVVYSHAHEPDFATNLLTGPYRGTGFANAVRDALGTLEGNLSELESYAPSQGAIAAFIAVPLVEHGRVDGVLAIQLRSEPIFAVIDDRVGLGETGETLLARRLDERTALVLAPLKFDPAAAMKRQIPLGDGREDKAIAKALRGERGGGLALDWRDQQVVAAWRYLPRMNCGLVVKIAANEALAPVARLRTLSLAIMGLATLAALLGAILLGGRVVGPIKLLTRGAHDLAAGDLSQRVPVQGQDELGQLGASFNTMAEQLAASRARLEEALAITRRQFEDLFEHGVDAIVMTNEEGRITLINRAAEEMFGYARAELVGQLVEVLLPMKARAGHGALRAGYHQNSAPRVMGSGRPDLRGVRKDGSEFPVEISLSPLQTTEGVKVAAAIRDVTARRQAEETVRASEARLRRVMEGSGQGYWDWDVISNQVTFSDRWFTMLDYQPADLEQNYAMWADLIHPDDRPAVLAALAAHVEGRTEIYAVELRMRTKTGAWKWILARGQLTRRDAAGKASFISGTHSDIDDRKQAEAAVRKSEAQLQLALDASHTALWDADIPAGRIFLDERWAAMLGEPPGGGTVSLRQLGHLVHPEDRAEVLRRQFEAIRGKKSDYDVEHRVRHRQGHWVWIRSRGQVVARDSAGLARRMIGTNTDITQRKLQEEQLRDTLAIVQAQAAALTGTVAVLEQTKRSFRSTALADLRRSLETLIASTGKR